MITSIARKIRAHPFVTSTQRREVRGGGGGWRKRAQNVDECECFIRDGGLFNKMSGRPQVKKINNHKSKIFKILIAGSISISDSFSGNIPPCEESDNFKEK